MIIIGQDKDIIVNFNRCNSILLQENEVVAMLDGQEWVIGIYKTEKRAREVLQNIYLYRAIFKLYKYADKKTRRKMEYDFIKDNVVFDVYEMPEE